MIKRCSEIYIRVLICIFLSYSNTAACANKALDTLIGSVNETIKTVNVSSSCSVNPYIGSLNSQEWGYYISPALEGCEAVVATCPVGTIAVKAASKCTLDTSSEEQSSLSMALKGSERYIIQPIRELTNVGSNPYDKTKNSVSCKYSNDWSLPINWDQSKNGYNPFCFVKLSKISSGPFYNSNGKIIGASSLALPDIITVQNPVTFKYESKAGLKVNGLSVYFDQAGKLPVTLSSEQLLARNNYQCFTSTITVTAGCLSVTPNVKSFVTKFLK